MTKPPCTLVLLLWTLLFAFCLRVLGQALVAFRELNIGLYSKVCVDSRGEGMFVQSRPSFGRGVLVFGYV